MGRGRRSAGGTPRTGHGIVTRSRVVRLSDDATRAQTRALGARPEALTRQLRAELGVPAVPAGNALLVLLMGLPGVGKSYVARALAARLAAAHVASDHLRSRLFIAPSYTEEENATVFGIAEALVSELLGEGHIVVLDATHLAERNRAPAEAAARERSAPIVHVLVTADEEATRGRIEARSRGRAAGDHSDADLRVYERMRLRGFEPPVDGYLEVRNGPSLDEDLERVVTAVRHAT